MLNFTPGRVDPAKSLYVRIVTSTFCDVIGYFTGFDEHIEAEDTALLCFCLGNLVGNLNNILEFTVSRDRSVFLVHFGPFMKFQGLLR